MSLGISRASNWAATFGLSSLVTLSKSINNHTFRVETDPKLAAKYPVEVMWHDENTFPASSMPDSTFKSLNQ
jgi:hypothetical protein